MQVKTLSKEDIHQAVELINSAYSRKKNERYFLWQYYSKNPFSRLWGVFIENNLVGMMGVHERKTIDGIRIGLAIDMVVKKTYRKRGIFKTLVEKALGSYKKIDLFCSFTNMVGMKTLTSGLGWKVVSKIDNQTIDLKDMSKTSDLVTKEPKSFIARPASFFYDESLLNWRFKKNPTYKYKQLKHKKTVAILKVFEDPISNERIGDIVYWTSEGSPENFYAVFEKIRKFFFIKKIDKVTSWALPGTKLNYYLRKLGFISIEQERYLCVNLVDKKLSYFLDQGQWEIHQADSEIY